MISLSIARPGLGLTAEEIQKLLRTGSADRFQRSDSPIDDGSSTPFYKNPVTLSLIGGSLLAAVGATMYFRKRGRRRR